MTWGEFLKQVEQEIAELIVQLPLFIDAIFKGFEAAIPFKLNLTEERTLMLIHMHPGEPMKVYSKHAGLSQGSFTSVADNLEKKELIKRTPLESDRRVSCLVLTEKGNATAKQIHAQFMECIKNRVSFMNATDKAALRNAMQTIIDTIELL